MKLLQKTGFVLGLLCCFSIARAGDVRQGVVGLVTQVQKADYEGNREALRRLVGELSPYVEDAELGAFVRYWRGFALWRRAINGFNETSPDPKDLEKDLQEAIAEFQKAVQMDPGFVDAKIGTMSCTGLIAFVHRENTEFVKESLTRIAPLTDEAKANYPDHPRWLWVMGPWTWNRPVEKGGGPAVSIGMYERGLESIKGTKYRSSDPLVPSWGEPELLMNLAWSYLNRPDPDLDTAEKYARAALNEVPYWHYVRDILLPQIQEARKKTK